MAKKKPKHKIASSGDYISTHHINVVNGDKLKWSGVRREKKCKYRIWHLTKKCVSLEMHQIFDLCMFNNHKVCKSLICGDLDKI